MKYKYQVFPKIPIRRLAGHSAIIRPTVIDLERDEVVVCLRYGNVFRMFSQDNQVKVTISNIDELHVPENRYGKKVAPVVDPINNPNIISNANTASVEKKAEEIAKREEKVSKPEEPVVVPDVVEEPKAEEKPVEEAPVEEKVEEKKEEAPVSEPEKPAEEPAENAEAKSEEVPTEETEKPAEAPVEEEKKEEVPAEEKKEEPAQENKKPVLNTLPPQVKKKKH